MNDILKANIFEVKFYQKSGYEIKELSGILTKFIRLAEDEIICVFNDWEKYEDIYQYTDSISTIEVFIANRNGEIIRKHVFDAVYDSRAYAYESPLDYTSSDTLKRAYKFKVIER